MVRGFGSTLPSAPQARASWNAWRKFRNAGRRDAPHSWLG